MFGSRSRARAVAWQATSMVVGLLAATATATATASPPASGAPGQGHDTRRLAVTLITGDRVLLDGDRVTSVVPGAGRGSTTFQTFQRDGHVHVVPRDAVRPLAEGRLDPRLFDVTGLVRAGYDDARRDGVPLIVTRSGDRSPQVAALRVTRDLATVGSVAAEAPKATASAGWSSLLADPGVAKVWLDGVRTPSLDRSTAQIGAPSAWAAGYTGAGVTVAVVDTGVDGDHPDLAGREIAERNFTADPDATDLVGHGTHVGAIIASRGTTYRGVAPDVRLLDAKVCGDSDGCRESSILEGLRWSAEQGADVVNVSLGGSDTEQVDLLEEAINTLSARHGTLFVVAAGNSGPGAETVGSPASADAALAVGAVERNDDIAFFSSRGPRVGDGAVKPEITAPGVDIVAAKAARGVIGTPVGEQHVSVSGTSMATPHVVGAAAVLAQQHPEWTGAQLKAALMASAKPNPAATAFDQGAGRVDLAEAITTTLTTEPTSVSLGVQPWPHDDDVPVDRELAYRNAGPTPVTLDLRVEADGPDGEPTRVFSVDPTTVTVPAGGEAKVTVTGDARLGTVDGAYSGFLVATAGAEVLRTPLGLNREVESYDVTLTHLDRAGNPESDFFTLIIGVSNDRSRFLGGPDGAVTTRLPKGDYYALSDMRSVGTDNTVLIRPDLEVAGDTAVTFDARTAKPVRITPPDPSATAGPAFVLTSRTHEGVPHALGGLYPAGFPTDMAIGHTGPELPAAEAAVMVGAEFHGAPVGATPVSYRLSWVERGRAPTGFVRAPAKGDLAEVRTRFGPGVPGKQYLHTGNARLPEGPSGIGELRPVSPLGSAIDHVTPDVRWEWTFYQENATGFEALLHSPPESYRAGRRHGKSFNEPVFGPAAPVSAGPYLFRRGDEVTADLWLFGDGAGNLGDSVVEEARTTLFRDGQRVGETPLAGVGRFPVPAGPAEYRLESEAVRSADLSPFATRVSGAWTFRSGTVAGAEVRPLPLTVVRFTPELDDSGAARAGRVLPVPLVVEQQPGADHGRIGRIDVEVSFDDGTTWSKAPVIGRTALVRNAGEPGTWASLRVGATDSKGNAVRQTVIRAYRLA